MASTGNAPIFARVCTRTVVVLLHGVYCGCTIAQCVLCLYLLYSVLVWPARVMYILPVFVLVLCVHHCTVCTVRVPLVQWFSMASTGSVPICPSLYSYCGCTIAQCVRCLYLLYSVLVWPARMMYLFFPCLYTYCACTIAQCVLCLYPLYTCACVVSSFSCWTSSSLDVPAGVTQEESHTGFSSTFLLRCMP